MKDEDGEITLYDKAFKVLLNNFKNIKPNQKNFKSVEIMYIFITIIYFILLE